MELTLLFVVTGHNKGDKLMRAARYAGTQGGTVMMGRGQSGNRILDFLALGDEGREILWIITEESELQRIKFAITDAAKEDQKTNGYLIELNVNQFMKSGQSVTGGEKMDHRNATHELLTVIVNTGYADDVMDAVRKKGAPGGTVISAHGTAKEGDASFFGIEIVPEKEMLVILCEKTQSETILNTLKTLPCLQEQGIGIAFSMDVRNYTTLGGKK
jgi:nitrogen regulatory protein PII